jgi:uncharacterized protein (TIGR02466 family)
MQVNYEILELFPTPVFTTYLPEKYSSVVPWFYKQEMLSEEIDSPNYGERSKNSYILDEPQCSELKFFILEIAKNYGKMLGYDYDSYRFGQSWLSYKHPGQHHTMHSHPNSLISGVFYFGEPVEKIPAIKFHKLIGGMNVSYISPKEINDKRELKYAQKEFSIEFTPGLLVLFPSYLHHSVPLNKSNKTRCSLAFNVVPSIGFGDERNLTELKF